MSFNSPYQIPEGLQALLERLYPAAGAAAPAAGVTFSDAAAAVGAAAAAAPSIASKVAPEVAPWLSAHPWLQGLGRDLMNPTGGPWTGVKIGGGLAGGGLVANFLADWFAGAMQSKRKRTGVKWIGEHPVQAEEMFAQDYLERQTAKKLEFERMQKIRGLGVADPKQYALLKALVAGDSVPRVGPGEHRVAGSELLDDEVAIRAAAHSDIWE